VGQDARAEGREFDEERVAADVRGLLPLASLLAVGEEGAWPRFWNAMGDAERDSSSRPCRTSCEAIEKFINTDPYGYERDEILGLRRMYDDHRDDQGICGGSRLRVAEMTIDRWARP
jgi:hypothetical protein